MIVADTGFWLALASLDEPLVAELRLRRHEVILRRGTSRRIGT
jgi:hypothetical protein